MKHPVKQIHSKSTIVKDLMRIANNDQPWVPYYNFMAKPAPYEVVFKDPFFQWLGQRYNFIAGILKMEAYQQYDWHVDSRRGVGINMLLEHDDSLLMFTETPNQLVKNVYPIRYAPKTYYIFDTQTPHCVINLSAPRFLFTVEFEKGLDELTFDDLKNDIRDNYRGGPNDEQE